jgi:carbon storage regulator CsrA
MAQGRQDRRGLTITRREGERIVCDLGSGDELIITVAHVRKNQVRVRVLAPPRVTVLREELVR